MPSPAMGKMQLAAVCRATQLAFSPARRWVIASRRPIMTCWAAGSRCAMASARAASICCREPSRSPRRKSSRPRSKWVCRRTSTGGEPASRVRMGASIAVPKNGWSPARVLAHSCAKSSGAAGTSAGFGVSAARLPSTTMSASAPNVARRFTASAWGSAFP